MTLADIIGDVRMELHDADLPYRWTAAVLTRFASDGCKVIAKLRPDSLYVSSVTVAEPTDFAEAAPESQNVPLADSFRASLVYYCCMRALQTDQEQAANLQAAENYRGRMQQELTS